jgi:predicted Zn-dependent protease
MLAQLQRTDLTGAATIALSTQADLCWYPFGRCAWGEATDSEITVTARTTDGTASGWSGHAARDWTQLRPERVVDEAMDLALRGQHPVRVEPGRYTAILGPAAVGQFLATGVAAFSAKLTDAGGTPFSLIGSPDGHRSKLYQRVMDERITLTTDPADVVGGHYPFFRQDGYPSGQTTWVKDGVLQELSYDEGYGSQRGKTPRNLPYAIRMSGGTTSIAEMIANCQRGIYVHRLSGVRLVDPFSGAMVGVTRDGCFLIKNGKIETPVMNFRFFESPFIAFNKILALGVPERVAFGMQSGIGTEYDGWSRPPWPLSPVIVPPLMIRDFNFSASSDAV